MGFFDKLRSWFEAPPEQNPSPKPEEQPKEDTLRKLLLSGSIPAKPSVLRKGSFGVDFTFMLSGDFIEFNSHSEMDPSYQYEPDNAENFTGYKEGLPVIAFGPHDKLYEAAYAYFENGTEIGKEFHRIDDGTFLFSTKIDYYDQLLYAYVFASETAWDHQMLGLMYDKGIEGTPLEQKLMAALDEAARTYREAGDD